MRNELTSILLTLRDFFQPLQRSLAGRDELEYLFYQYGWDVPLEIDVFELVRERANLTGLVDTFLAEADAVREELTSPDAQLNPEQIQRLATAAQQALRGIAGLELSDLAQLPAPLGDEAFWQDVGGHVLDDLLERYIRINSPQAYFVLRLFGVIRYEPVNPQAPHRRPYNRTIVDWDRAMIFVTDPAEAFKATYQWANPAKALHHEELLAALVDVFRANGVMARLLPISETLASAVPAGDWRLERDHHALRLQFLQTIAPRDGVVYEFGIDVVPTTSVAAGRVTALAISPVLRGGTNLNVPIAPALFLKAKAAAAATPPALVVSPDGTSWLSGQIDTGVEIAVVRESTGPLRLFGSAEGSRIDVSSVSFCLTISGPPNDPHVCVALKLGSEPAGTEGGRIVIALGDADDFVTNMSGGDDIEIPFALDMSWSSESGLRLNGSAGLDVTIPFRLPLLGAELRDAHLVLRQREVPTVRPQVELKVGTALKGKLGPIEFLVADFGFALRAIRYTDDELLALPVEREPLFGTLDVQLAFSPPNGVGLSIDAGPVTGGGFLWFDPERGQYAGDAQLRFEQIAVRATGLLSTRLPDGKPGFSLLVLVSADFPPVQLGLGFMLVGVGGLLGINRTVAVEALRAGVKTGGLGAVLSPPDPTANAGQVVASLAGLFPASAGRHVFGPTARIVWGSPTLITIELCLVLELPAPVRLVALGRLRAVLPDERAAIVVLQMDVLGVVDFDRREASVDATLIDSRLARFVLTGDMALRMSWGSQSTFLLAVGGFHPRFAAPPGFPALTRVAVALATGENPKLRLEAYLALTSNTVQLGARVDLYARAGRFSIAGFLSFDALVMLDPLAFIVDIAAKLAVKAGTHTLLSVSLALTLSGPQPWRARGRASFSILFLDVSFGFDVTIGDGGAPALPPPVDVAALVRAAFADPRSWSAKLPAGGAALVTLRAVDPGTEVLAHPLGTLEVRQRVAPLERTLERFGSSVPGGARRFRIVGATTGPPDDPVEAAVDTGVRDLFAPAQFGVFSDDEKLSLPSFVLMPSGAVIAAAEAAHGAPVSVTIGYEEMLVTAEGITVRDPA